MLVKPRTEQPIQQTIPKQVRTSRKQCVCNKCHKTQSYKEVPIQIQYGLNCKQSVLIDGIERICAVCGWHVDDIATTEINSEIAKEKLRNL